MDNQHRQISGYRELSADEILLINLIKEVGKQVGGTVDDVATLPDADQRALSIARTHLQTGLMWLTRAIAKPEGF